MPTPPIRPRLSAFAVGVRRKVKKNERDDLVAQCRRGAAVTDLHEVLARARVFFFGISASPTACPLRGYYRHLGIADGMSIARAVLKVTASPRRLF